MPVDGLGFRTNPGDEERYKFDRYAHAATMIAETHRMVHDGMFFHFDRRVAGIVNGASSDILLAVPAGVFPHLNTTLITTDTGGVDVKFYEGTTTSADGTAVSTFNRNRNSTNTPSTVITHTPTVTGVGTLIHDALIPAPAKDAGLISAAVNEEWVLKPSTKYLLRVTNNSGGNVEVVFDVAWYEIGYAV